MTDTPLLPIDTFFRALGLHPWHVWQLAGAPVPLRSECPALTYEYSWQGADTAGRDDVRDAIVRAEQKLAGYLGYRIAPQYVEATVPYPRLGAGASSRAWNMDPTGRRVGVWAPEGYVQALGVEQHTSIGAAALTFSDRFSTGVHDTFSATLPIPSGMALTADQVAVYIAAADRYDDTALSARWRIQPVQVSISGGNVTISGRRWLLVRPVLYESPVARPLDPATAGNFVTTLEVYQRTTNGDGMTVNDCPATLLYESAGCGGWWGCGPAGSTDPAAVGSVVARADIRDRTLGLLTPAAATYDASTGTWSAAPCGGCAPDPDRVTLRYLAGAPLDADGQIAAPLRQAVIALAAAELKQRICACRESNERLHTLQQDLTLESTQTERYQVAPEDLRNPFGTRRGHVQAWKIAQDYLLRRGTTA